MQGTCSTGSIEALPGNQYLLSSAVAMTLIVSILCLFTGCKRAEQTSQRSPVSTDTRSSVTSNPTADDPDQSKLGSQILPFSGQPIGSYVLVSKGLDVEIVDGESDHGSISEDGNVIVFDSNSRNLVPENDEGLFDVFVYSPISSSVRAVRQMIETASTGSSRRPSVSQNGQSVAFESNIEDLVQADANSATDVFVLDLNTQGVERVSINSDGVEANGYSFDSTIDKEGRRVAFTSSATNLVLNDTNAADDVFMHDSGTQKTIRISVDSTGHAPMNGNRHSSEPSISGDGQVIAFSSFSTVLTDVNTRGFSNVYIHDVDTTNTTLISAGGAGEAANGDSAQPSLNNSGRFVAFSSSASNLVESDNNGESDIFLHDRQNGTTVLISNGYDGGKRSNGYSIEPAISADGGRVAYRSQATNLTDYDNNGFEDVFVFDVNTMVTNKVGSGEGDSRSGRPSISGDGRLVVFTSAASNLVSGDSNRTPDVFAVRID